MAPAGQGERSRRRSSSGHTQSQGDLRRISGDLQDTSSEEDASWSKHRAASTDRRLLGERQGGPGRAKSERDLSRVARVNLGNGAGAREGGATPVQKARAKMKTTTIISNDGAVVVKHPEPQFSARGTEAVDVTRAPLSRHLAEVSIILRVSVKCEDQISGFNFVCLQRCGAKMQEAADDLVKLYKRISLDDDLDDTLRGQLLSQLSAGAGLTAGTLRLVIGDEDRGGGGHSDLSSWGFKSQGHTNSQHQDLSANPYFQA